MRWVPLRLLKRSFALPYILKTLKDLLIFENLLQLKFNYLLLFILTVYAILFHWTFHISSRPISSPTLFISSSSHESSASPVLKKKNRNNLAFRKTYYCYYKFSQRMNSETFFWEFWVLTTKKNLKITFLKKIKYI